MNVIFPLLQLFLHLMILIAVFLTNGEISRRQIHRQLFLFQLGLTLVLLVVQLPTVLS